jgi:hypothetical protein
MNDRSVETAGVILVIGFSIMLVLLGIAAIIWAL